MIDVVPLTPELLRAIVPQNQQRLPVEHAEALAAPKGNAYAALVDGQPVAAAGVVELWTGRAHAWALIGEDAGPHMLHITRATRSFLDRLPCRRVEMAVDAEFPQAIRWACMLGFTCETPEPMRRYTPDGRDAYLFARIHP